MKGQIECVSKDLTFFYSMTYTSLSSFLSNINIVRRMFIMQYPLNIYCSIYQISTAVSIKNFCNIYQISFLSHDFLFLEREGGERSLEGPTTPFSRETNNNAFSSQYFPIFHNNSKCFPIFFKTSRFF